MLFKSALSKVDVTFQNLDSSEISISDVSHYYDSDPTKVVAGLRTDKKKPTSFMADTTTANAQVRTLSETVRLDSRTKLLNPKFYEGMLNSGYVEKTTACCARATTTPLCCCCCCGPCALPARCTTTPLYHD